MLSNNGMKFKTMKFVARYGAHQLLGEATPAHSAQVNPHAAPLPYG